MAVKIKGITEEFNKIMKEYTDEVEKGVTLAGTNIAKKTVKRLRKTSPKYKGKNGGSYAKGWRVTEIDGKNVIHNKTDYQLTHLLENGHAKVNGGRVAARVHIRPAEEEAINEYIKEVEKVIKR